uniref:Transposase MuDR plant domain-containing protein n=1 Tax=Lactuca sativa TaxID=4236 RepID=A0A9R1VSM5_LACSA|nr:hypothetical protein LSAT_V11C400181250 [Lactuca sativa]
MNDVGDVGDDVITDLEDKIHIDVWKESENKIRLGMQFESKVQVKCMYKSKSNLWVAKCKTLGGEGQSTTTMNYIPRCAWYVRAVKKKNNQMWKITRWLDAHNCFGSCIGNNNRSLNSLTISSYTLRSIEIICCLSSETYTIIY